MTDYESINFFKEGIVLSRITWGIVSIIWGFVSITWAQFCQHINFTMVTWVTFIDVAFLLVLKSN